jgi:hypothetical protein
MRQRIKLAQALVHDPDDLNRLLASERIEISGQSLPSGQRLWGPAGARGPI